MEGTQAQPTQTDLPPGIDATNVTGWFEQHAPAVTPPLTFQLIAGGHSNLTYRVDDTAGHSWVLRRPPLGHVLATAHDMAREHRIISALAPTDVPVAPVIGLCQDEQVNGAPFYVMDFVEGAVLRNSGAAKDFSLEARTHAGHETADVLAKIHAVDPDKVGLGELGRKEAYIERQLKRWHRQWEQSKTRELPVVEEVHEALAAGIPEQGPAAIVHGDYRLDNCLVAPDGAISAVLDWELCTLGDPMADLGLLLVYWAEADDQVAALGDSATLLDGFPSRAELIERYASASGRDAARDPSRVNYYMAFGYWKLACILEGVFARYQAGAMGQAGGFEGFGLQVEVLAQAARTTLDDNK
ncbi:MAG TPA: phosphotransferase family protein [Acidimicrobiales bacterium]|jgi:aminoglycoside phosphotransferase (APT) family kinase protein